jgi:hypothetical protein
MNRKRWISLVLGAGILLTTAACGSRAAFEPIGAPVEDIAVSEGVVGYDAPGAGDYDGGVPVEPITVERMVIRTADLDVIVPETEGALSEIEDLASELGGYVVSIDTYQYDQGVRGTIIVRVPADEFDTVLDRIAELATTVVRESVSGQDVTEEYVDLGSQLRHLEVVEEQLLEFLDEAEDTEAALAVFEELERIQARKEQVIGRIEYLEDQAALSTVTVSLTPDALAQPLEVSGWNLPGTLRNAVESLIAVMQFLVKALIYIVVLGLPTLMFLALPIAGTVLLIRALARRRRARKNAAEES